MNKVDMNKIVISDKDWYDKKYSFKYVFGYKSNKVIGSLRIKIPQVSEYAKYFEVKKNMNLDW